MSGLRLVYRRVASLMSPKAGVAAVEFGIFAPIILLMFAGLADFSMYIQDRLELEQAVRAGGQYALRNPGNPTAIAGSVVSATTLPITSANVSVSALQCECLTGVTNVCTGDLNYTPCADGLAPAEYITIMATTIYDPLFLNLPTLTSNMSINQQLIMRIR
jgi:Flp pilus assembly protein TadG